MRNVAEIRCRHTNSPKLNLLGYCMGGTMSAMYTALYPEQVRNLILMAAPIDFSGDEGLLQRLDPARSISTSTRWSMPSAIALARSCNPAFK